MICYNEFIGSLVNEISELWMTPYFFLIVGAVAGRGSLAIFFPKGKLYI